MSSRSLSLRQNFWRKRITPGQVMIFIILMLVFIISFYPFFYMLFLSVMPYDRFVSSPVHILPNGFTLQYFKQILEDPNLPHAFQISGLRVLAGTILNVVATMMVGYALSRPALRYRRVLTFLFLIPMYFGAGLIPYYLTINALGLRNNFLVMILPGLVGPMWFFIARAALTAFPQEIIEAATIDGANQWRTFWQIIWPTNMPTVAMLAMMYGTGHWNEYFMSRILLTKDLWPAPVHLYSMMNSKIILQGLGLGVRLVPQSYLAAIAACLIIPIFIAYPLLQRYVISGLTVGAVKG